MQIVKSLKLLYTITLAPISPRAVARAQRFAGMTILIEVAIYKQTLFRGGIIERWIG